MENINAVLINDSIPQNERLLRLNKIAIQQMTVLVEVQGRKLLFFIPAHENKLYAIFLHILIFSVNALCCRKGLVLIFDVLYIDLSIGCYMIMEGL
jgi:hypothetical protein